MRRIKKMLSMLVIAVMLVCMMAGCGQKFDATGCVNAFMELITTGNTENYVKYTKQSTEDAEKDYTAMIDAISSMLESYGAAGDVQEELKNIYLELLSKAKYTVKEAKETEDGFEVDVEIEPIMGMYDGLYDELNEEGQAYAQELIDSGKNIDQTELTQWMFGKMAEKMRDRLETITYGDPTTVTVHINKKDGNYVVDDADGTAIGEAIVDLTGAN